MTLPSPLDSLFRSVATLAGAIVLESCLFGGWPAAGATAQAVPPAVLWHSFDGQAAVLLRQLINEFNRTDAGSIRDETGMDLVPALLTQKEVGDLPVAVLAPSDMLGIAKTLRASLIDAKLMPKNIDRDAQASVKIGKEMWGVPVLDGNVLLLFYNRRLVGDREFTGATVPPAIARAFNERFARGDIRSRESAVPTAQPQVPPFIGWKWDEPYVFLAFATAYGLSAQRPFFGLDTPAMTRALTAYNELRNEVPALTTCGYDCATKKFYNGEIPAVINGDWALNEAIDALGPDFGVAPLPDFGGAPMRSPRTTHALFFPGQSLAGPHGRTLVAFATFLTSPKVQGRWFKTARRLPVDTVQRATISHSINPIDRALMASLRQSVTLSPDENTPGAWQILGKGLRLVMDDTFDVEAAQHYMTSLVAASRRR